MLGIKIGKITATFALGGSLLFATVASLAVETSTTPKQGGTLIFGRGGDSVSLDPAAVTDGESLNVTDHIFDTLVAFKPGTTDIEPGLAESWVVAPDGMTYTFTLRTGAKFHDETPVNADAVVFSFMRQMDPNHPAHKLGGPYLYFSYLNLGKTIKAITKVDDRTVRFELTKPDSPFMSTLGMQAFAIVSPAGVTKHGRDFGRNPVGSGPFRFVKWEKNQKITLDANTAYWDGRPHVDKLIFRSIPDNSTRLMEMMAGNLHVMDNPKPDDISVLKEKMRDKVTIAEKPGFNVGYLAMNSEKKPFDNVLVRRAISHAINKKGIIEAIYAGHGTAAKNPMPPTLWGHADTIGEYEYSPEKAKQLLVEAKMPNGFETTLWAMPVPRPYMPDGRKVAEAIQADLAKIGVKVKIVSFDWATYLEKTQQGEHDMALLGWTGDIGDPDNFLYVLLDKDNAVKPAGNISFYKSDEVHDLLMKAKREPSQDKRALLYQQAQQIIHRDAPMVPLAHSIDMVPIQSRVANFVIDPTGRRRFDRVWLQ